MELARRSPLGTPGRQASTCVAEKPTLRRPCSWAGWTGTVLGLTSPMGRSAGHGVRWALSASKSIPVRGLDLPARSSGRGPVPPPRPRLAGAGREHWMSAVHDAFVRSPPPRVTCITRTTVLIATKVKHYRSPCQAWRRMCLIVPMFNKSDAHRVNVTRLPTLALLIRLRRFAGV